MTTLHVSVKDLSGDVNLYEPTERAAIWLWPYSGYPDNGEQVSEAILKTPLVDGVADVLVPPTPVGNALWVQLRNVRGFGSQEDRWLISIPSSGTVNLVDLPHIDPTTLDPETPLDPAWLAALEQAQADIVTAQSTANSALSGLSTKVNTSTYTAGLATKADSSALSAEATRATTAEALLTPLTDVGLLPIPARVPVSRNRTLVTAFQAGHGWTTGGSPTASNLNDTSDPGLGSQCVSWTTANGAASYIDSPTLGTALDLTAKTFSILVQVPLTGFDNMSYAYIYAGSGGSFTNYYTFRIRLRSAQQNNESAYTTPGAWVWLTCSWADVAVGAGTPVRSAINKLRVMVGPLAGTTTSIRVGAIATVPMPTTAYPNGVVSLTFDDGYGSLASIIKPYMDKYAMRGTIFPIREVIDTSGKVTSAQLKQFDRDGWEIGLHSDTLAGHAAGLDLMTQANIWAELGNESKWLSQNGFGARTGFAWPRGRISAAAIESVRRGAAYGRGNDYASGGETYPPGDPYRIRSWPVGSADALATLTALVTAAKNNQGWQVFTIHEVVASGATGGQQMNTAIFTGLIDFIATAGIPVLPMGEVLPASVS